MNRKFSEFNFKLWLEFEEVDQKNWDKENEFFNLKREELPTKLQNDTILFKRQIN